MNKPRSLNNKRILITAGPTWVSVDSVRILSNVSTGELGILLAKQAKQQGMKVDLLLGPVGRIDLDKGINLYRFRFFSELDSLVKRILNRKNYDVILHAAAVSDFLPLNKNGKISSKKRILSLKFKQAPKIISTIRRLQKRSFLVIFKLEVGIRDSQLLKRSHLALKNSGADLVVANTIKDGKYKGYILDSSNMAFSVCNTRKQLSKNLFKILSKL